MISLIAAIGKNGELGKNNALIWNIPGDLKFFREKTTGHSVVMGLNTYLSIGKALPKRRNIVISKDNDINNEDIILYNDINVLISNELNNEEENFIIGGASMYNYFYPLADRMYLTLIDAEDKDADTYFPKINEKDWEQTILAENEDNGIKYKHVLFERLKNE